MHRLLLQLQYSNRTLPAVVVAAAAAAAAHAGGSYRVFCAQACSDSVDRLSRAERIPHPSPASCVPPSLSLRIWVGWLRVLVLEISSTCRTYRSTAVSRQIDTGSSNQRNSITHDLELRTRSCLAATGYRYSSYSYVYMYVHVARMDVKQLSGFPFD